MFFFLINPDAVKLFGRSKMYSTAKHHGTNHIWEKNCISCFLILGGVDFYGTVHIELDFFVNLHSKLFSLSDFTNLSEENFYTVSDLKKVFVKSPTDKNLTGTLAKILPQCECVSYK